MGFSVAGLLASRSAAQACRGWPRLTRGCQGTAIRHGDRAVGSPKACDTAAARPPGHVAPLGVNHARSDRARCCAWPNAQRSTGPEGVDNQRCAWRCLESYKVSAALLASALQGELMAVPTMSQARRPASSRSQRERPREQAMRALRVRSVTVITSLS